ncbi:SMI1/KNR4 family protein [Aeoliella sp.]|uniref:SMI1/KNR4 family protein n=1 Tax=Aeoliella sp. TaxID=2795800 RepID=UPI003CCC179C
MDDWRKQIALAHLVKERVAELDIQGLWPLHLPEIAATEDQIRAAEQNIGESIDPHYRSFLGYANGWRCLFQTIDLFGTNDLVSGDAYKKASQLLDSLKDLRSVCGLDASEVLPIAVSQDSIDVMVIGRRSTSRPGEVFWVAGQLIDSFPGFDEFFLAMVDYNREEAKAFEQQQ